MNYWIIGGIVVVIIGGGVWFAMQSPNEVKMDDAMMEDKMDGDAMMEEDHMDNGAMMEEKMEDDAMMEKDDSMMDDGESMSSNGSFEAYAPEKLAMANDGDVVLFFHASWCPTCRALEADIEENTDSIPGGLTILKTDFDRETELRQQYGVTFQHTLVQVDAEGNMIAKWTGSPTLDALIGEVI